MNECQSWVYLFFAQKSLHMIGIFLIYIFPNIYVILVADYKRESFVNIFQIDVK